MTAPRIFVLAAAMLAFAACSEWQHNVTVHGIAFEKVRLTDRGLAIGQLKNATVIGGRPCQSGWVHVHPNGTAAGFTAAREIDAGRFTIPADTWVFQDAAGTVTICAFPRDTTIQGHVCRGTGGPKGVQAAFYPGGALRQYYPPRDTVVDGVPCRANLIDGWVELHENGRLKSARLAAALTRDGRTYAAGKHVTFALDGTIVPPAPAHR